MKNVADAKRRDVQFDIGDLVYLKIRPYRRKSLASRPNEKLAPRFYGPFEIEKKIVPVAYKLALPTTCNIHSVFHVSQLRKAEGVGKAVTEVPSQLSEDLEMMVELEVVLGVRPGSGNNIRGIDVLIQWKWLPPLEATWEPFNLLKLQFPDFHLEDKVSFLGGSNDRPAIQNTYKRRGKGARAEKAINLGGIQLTACAHHRSSYNSWTHHTTDKRGGEEKQEASKKIQKSERRELGLSNAQISCISS
ncbi:Ribonuclease H-like domain containing protein [Abeliophyllum distichum]|uniref:Ribonuclease H-like domain containing protein n=1 Tax=Abeliophyllum distichum TaxID=126358 RepID=A0ABD1SZZ7_9LAMI